MVGPLLAQELLRGRRGRLEILRRAYASWMILQFTFLFSSHYSEAIARERTPIANSKTAAVQSRFVNSYLDLFVVQHFLLIGFATPAFVCGALAEEKSHMTLTMLLTTDLTSSDIVLGNTPSANKMLDSIGSASVN